jgi:hypothetical protein
MIARKGQRDWRAGEKSSGTGQLERTIVTAIRVRAIMTRQDAQNMTGQKA